MVVLAEIDEEFDEDTVVVDSDAVVVVSGELDEESWGIVASSEVIDAEPVLATKGVSEQSTLSLKAAFSSLLRECQCSLNFSLMPSMLS